MVETVKQRTLKGALTHYWKAQATLLGKLVEVKDTGGEDKTIPRYEVRVDGQMHIQCSTSKLELLEIQLAQVYGYTKGSVVWIPILDIE